MRKRVTYCAILDEFINTKFMISHETQEHNSKSVNSMERKLAGKSERRCATENKMPAWQSSEKLNQFKELKLHFSPKLSREHNRDYNHLYKTLHHYFLCLK